MDLTKSKWEARPCQNGFKGWMVVDADTDKAVVAAQNVGVLPGMSFGYGYEPLSREVAEAISLLPSVLADNRELRRMLAMSYSGPIKLYADDGELQDNSERPFIDFKRDSIESIQSAMMIRMTNWMEEHTDSVNEICHRKLSE